MLPMTCAAIFLFYRNLFAAANNWCINKIIPMRLLVNEINTFIWSLNVEMLYIVYTFFFYVLSESQETCVLNCRLIFH